MFGLVSALLLEYLGTSGGRQSVCKSPAVRDVTDIGCERFSERFSNGGKPFGGYSLFSLVGLELLSFQVQVHQPHLEVFAWGGLLGLTVGYLVVALDQFFLDLREWRRSNQKSEHASVEAQQVKGRAEPVVVDLENCFVSDSSELEQHDFKAELAALKCISISEVESNLCILNNKIEAASLLFGQVEKKIQSRTTSLLTSQKPTVDDVMYVIIEFWSTYSLSVSAYELLLEVVEQFWDYCSVKMRRYLKTKAQKILNGGHHKIHLTPKDREALGTGKLAEVGIRILTDEEEQFKLVGSLDKNWSGGEIGILQSIESYNNYIDVALRFAYSVFGAIARDNNRDSLDGIDETEYLFGLSDKNAARLMSALDEVEQGGREMSFEELCEEFNFDEEEET